jgi:hypothetical protein
MSARADWGPPILEASPVDSDGPNSMVVRKGRWSMKRQSGAKAMVLAIILFSPPLIWSSARADLLSLSFATIATAVDTGQQEGIFDLLIGVGNINLAHDVTRFINGLWSSGTAFAGFSCGSSMV